MRPFSVTDRKASRNKALLWGALIGIAMFLLDNCVQALIADRNPASMNLATSTIVISAVFLTLAGGFTGQATGRVGPGVLASVVAALVSSVLAVGLLALFLFLLATAPLGKPSPGYGIGILLIVTALPFIVQSLIEDFVVRLVIAFTLGTLAALIGSRFYQPPEDPSMYPGYAGQPDRPDHPPAAGDTLPSLPNHASAPPTTDS